MKTVIYDLQTQYEEGMAHACEVIREGGLVAFPTETVYGLGADAENQAAVRGIFEAKGRPADNPLIVHIWSFDQVDEIAQEVTSLARKLIQAFWPGPFTAILRARGNFAPEVSAGLDTVGIRMPESEIARELIRRSGKYIAAPSANLSGRPSPTLARHVAQDFAGKVPVILDGGPARVGLESTVVDLTGEVPVVLRPGGVTAEMIRRVAGTVEISAAVLNGVREGEKVSSPGMKYKHYAPRAQVSVVDGPSRKAIAFQINSMYDSIKQNGGRPLILCLKQEQASFEGRDALLLGESPDEEAAHLFDALRRSDEENATHVFFPAMQTTGIGLAVMNRIIRAAGFRIVQAAKEE